MYIMYNDHIVPLILISANYKVLFEISDFQVSEIDIFAADDGVVEESGDIDGDYDGDDGDADGDNVG